VEGKNICKKRRCKSLKLKTIFMVLSIFFIIIFSNNLSIAAFEQSSDNYLINMKRDLLCLMMAYPEYVKDVLKNQDGKVYIVMRSGMKILYDDMKEKNIVQKENNTDIQDMMEQIYPLEHISDILPENYDPGRRRVYALLNEVYGSSRQQIQKNLTSVNVGRVYMFNKNNNAAAFLQNAVREATIQMKSKPSIGGFLYPMSGTFNYRVISGTGRLSPHSYGIAIDLRSNKADYWKWASKEQGRRRLNSYPIEIVQCFENNGFIWGGKWNHFDILHFEYRPELIMKGRYFSKMPQEGKQWYEVDNLNMETIKEYIEVINKISQ
jgi:hypothetical protein